MLLKALDRLLTPDVLQKTDFSLAGTTQRIDLPRDWPLEEIIINCDFTLGATTDLTLTGDGLQGLIKRVRLITNSTKQVPVLDFSGCGLLELASQCGSNLDSATLASIGLVTKSSIGRIQYRIPLVHPMITETLRTQMLLPVHQHSMNPQLQIEFATGAEMYSAGSAIAKLSCDILLRQRKMTSGVEAKIQASGGYIQSDLMETVYTLGTGVTGEQRFDIPLPGQYAGLLIRFYKGGAAFTRNDPSETTTTGAETRWRLESQGFVFREGRLKHWKGINEQSRPLNSAVQASSPNIGEALASNTTYQGIGNIYLDFLSDGMSDVNELGSLLDCNFPAASGQKMQFIGSVASAATNGHKFYFGGHRFYGDLSRWQADKS